MVGRTTQPACPVGDSETSNRAVLPDMLPSIVHLVEILRRREEKTLEFKRDLSSPGGALKTIVAFANTAGGTLLVGVEDRTRHVRGVPVALRLEERLASLVSDRIGPRLVAEIEILHWRRSQVLAVQVHPSPSRPHYLIREGPTAGVYVRVGSTNRRADAELIDELRRFVRGEDLPRSVSKLRNRVIGRVFHALGLIEQWGSGVQRMTAACQAAGLPAPVFEEIATRFRVTIATTRVGPRVVEDTDQAILDALRGAKGRATSEIAATIGLSPRATRTRLARLVGRGLVREIGTGPQDPRRRYFLAERGPA